MFNRDINIYHLVLHNIVYSVGAVRPEQWTYAISFPRFWLES